MKFLHLSDLHIGKRINGISLYADQKYILEQIIEIIKQYQPDAVVIAGDIYDKSMPSADAVTLLDDFLTALSEQNLPVMIISGNHDSPERLAFGGRIMADKNIHIYSEFDGSLHCVRVQDVNFYLLPFVKPQMVRLFYDRPELRDYNEMAELIFKDFTKSGKSVLVMHQFVTVGGAETERGGSEVVNVGTLDNIDVSWLQDFDYVALGHIHKLQCVGNEKIVYCGSPLKYSFAEVGTPKYAVMVDADRDMAIEKIPLVPLRDMRKIKGKIEDLLNPDYYAETNLSDYLHITLTDEDELSDVRGRLSDVYENILEIELERDQRLTKAAAVSAETIRQRTPLELFEQFFEEQNNRKMNDEQEKLVKEVMEEICGRSN